MAPESPESSKLDLVFSATFDGSDYIHIKRNKVWIVHATRDLPSGVTIQGEYAGSLSWSDGSNEGSTSNEITIPNDGNSGEKVNISLAKLEGRGDITVVQYPSSSNDYESIVFVDDDDPSGPDDYEFRLRFGISVDPFSHVTTQTSLRSLKPISYRHRGIAYSSLPPSENPPIGFFWRLYEPFLTVYPETFSTTNGWTFNIEAVPVVYTENFNTNEGWRLYEPFTLPEYEEDFSTEEGWSLYEPFLTVYEEPFDDDAGWTLVSN